jgi:pimeloyl-ACP methyl ester carboxylesterase
MRPTRIYVDGPFGQIHCRICGSGRPLILLHQSPLSSLQFAPVLPRLAGADFSAVAIDLPGFGMSDPLTQEPSFAAYAASIEAVCAAFGFERVALLGHHTGAVIAASFAARARERVERLVLNGFPLLRPEERAFFRSFDFGPVRPRPDGSHLTEAWQSRLRATPGWTDLDAMHRYVVDGLVAGGTNWLAFPLIIDADLDGLLAALDVPTLLLTNTGEDLYAATRRAALNHPRFGYAELQGGTHDIIDEQPDAWAAAVVEFLA